MGRNGVAKEQELRSDTGKCDIDTLRVEVERQIRGRSEVGRQTAVHSRVDELGHLLEGHLALGAQSQSDLFDSIGHGHSLEVASVVDATIAVVWVDHGVVGGTVDLDIDRSLGILDILKTGPTHCEAVRSVYRS